MKQYVTTKVKFNVLNKKLTRLFKKMDAIGATYTFTVDEEFVREVPVYANDDIARVTFNTHNTVLVDCVRFTLGFNTYVVGNYRVGAVVERSTDENVNLVYTVDETVDFANYMNATLRCDHCGTNHNRKKVVVLVDNETGEQKMVGRACLKDFIGYNVESFAGYFDDIQSILLNEEEPRIYDTELGTYKCYIDNKTYLAYCINLIENCGYTKTVKTDALKNMDKKIKINDTDYETADKVIEFFKNYETNDIFENNVRLFVTGLTPISWENGLVAYAYELYKKIIARQEELANRKPSNFYGNVGDRINITGKIIRAGYYDTQFGTVVIFKITDENGNIFIWKTTSFVDVDNNVTVNVTGTIKEHNEYRDEKQTVLTRCKIRELVAG